MSDLRENAVRLGREENVTGVCSRVNAANGVMLEFLAESESIFFLFRS